MIIALISQEKNLGILTLTDYIQNKLGKSNCSVVGWNYLTTDYKNILDKIKEFSDNNRNVIIKYVVPKIKFSNQEIAYPEELNKISDVIFRVPSYKEEIAPVVPIDLYKGENNPVVECIKEFYR